MSEIKHNAPGAGGGGGTDDQIASEVPTDYSQFGGNLSVADTDVQLALETIDDLVIVDGSKLDDIILTGFVDKSDTLISFDDGTYTFEIVWAVSGVEYEYYSGGTLYTSDGDTVQLPGTPTSGLYFIYYDGATLTSTAVNPSDATLSPIIRTKCLVGCVYWNNTEGEGIYVGDERHGISMAGDTHAYLHFYVKLAYIFGLALNDFDAGGLGPGFNAIAQFGVAVGAVADEDLYTAISAVPTTTGMPEYYMIGAGSEWTKNFNAGFSIDTMDGTTAHYPYWNEYTGGAWQKTEMGGGKYVLRHIYATTEKDTPMISVVGQAVYDNKPDAYEGAKTEILALSLTNLPLPELKAIGSVLFQATSGTTNDVRCKAALNDDGDWWVDWRNSIIDRTASSPVEHNLLTGLQGGDVNEYFHLASAHHADLTDGTGTTLHTHAHANMTGQTVNDHHTEVHTIVSHDTTATGANLTELTDSSETTLHSHAGGSGDVIGPGPFVTTETIPVWDGTGGLTLKETTAAISSGNLTITGNIVVTGTTDGRDVSVDGAKLDNIEAFAEKNTASNSGTGIGVYGGKVASNLAFKALKDDGAGTMDIALSGDSLSIEFAVSASSIDTAQLAPNSVDNTILDDMPTLTMKGNDTGGTANPKDLTVAEVNSMLGGGAPADAEYVTVGSEAGLSAEHVLVGRYGIDLTDGAGTLTIDAVTEDYYALTSASSVTPDHANGPKYEVVAAHDIVFAIPTDHANWVDGQVVEYRIEQDGTGSRDVTFSVDYRTGEIPSMATAQGAGEITYVLMKYHAGDDKMDVVAFMRGYIT